MLSNTNTSSDVRKMKATLVKIAGVALVGIGLAWADGTSEVIITDEGNTQTALITFEGLVGETEIGLVAEAGADLTGWNARVEDGYANAPTNPTVAFFTADPGVVTFDPPVSRVSFYYASLYDLPLKVNGQNHQTLPANPDWSDPVVPLKYWDLVTVDFGENLITQIEISGPPHGYSYVDNFSVTRITAPPPVVAEIDLKPENYPNDVDPFNLNSNKPVEACVFSTAEFDATTIDLATVELGDPTLTGTVAALSATPEDVDGDGLMDVVFHFGYARDFGDEGALDEFSLEVLLTGLTSEGAEVFGLDEVNIVGGGN